MTITHVGALPPIICVEDFRVFCPDMSADDVQLSEMLNSVSSAIRSYCGWHVAPNFNCTYTGEGEPYGALLMLPAMNVTAVDSLTVDGSEVDASEYEWHENGMVRLTNGVFPDSWRSVTCAFDAGYSSGALAHIVVQIASNALVAAPGVANERVGDVSITYNQTGAGITGGVSLLERDKEQLAPFKLAGAW